MTAGAIQKAVVAPDAAILRHDENQPLGYVATGANPVARPAVEIGERKGANADSERDLPGERSEETAAYS